MTDTGYKKQYQLSSNENSELCKLTILYQLKLYLDNKTTLNFCWKLNMITIDPGAVLDKNIWGQCPQIEVPKGGRIRGLGSVVSSELPSAVHKRILAYFKPQNAPFCSYMPMLEFRQTVVSCHIWGKAEVWGQLPLPQSRTARNRTTTPKQFKRQ